VLAQANRITSGSDYKAVVRRGARVVSPHFVAYLRANPSTGSAPVVVSAAEISNASALPVRFGFIVAKNVGGAVVRNLVRRRLKAASYSLLSEVPPGTDVVLRALPSAVSAEWVTLRTELQATISRGRRRQ
jgi:ribonuclease P protein component